MGLDVYFCRNEEVTFYMRGHYDFFRLFDPRIGGPVDDIHDDFYVTLGTLDLVEARLEELFARCHVAASDALIEVPTDFDYLDARKIDLRDLLPYYPAVVKLLRADIKKQGSLICGWSA